MEIKFEWEFITPETKKEEEKRKFKNREAFLFAYMFDVPMCLKIEGKYQKITKVLDTDFVNKEGEHLILLKVEKGKGYTIKAIRADLRNAELYY